MSILVDFTRMGQGVDWQEILSALKYMSIAKCWAQTQLWWVKDLQIHRKVPFNVVLADSILVNGWVIPGR